MKRHALLVELQNRRSPKTRRSEEPPFGPRASHVARLAAIAACVVLLPAPPARAQAGWTEVVTNVSGTTAFGAPVIAVDAEGNALVAWQAASSVQAARYDRASGIWSRPADVLRASGGAISLSVNERGDALLASGYYQPWESSEAGVEAALLSAGSATWSRPTEFSRFGMLVGGAIDRQGNAFVAWTERIGTDDVLKTATYRRAAAAWSRAPDVPVSPVGGNSWIRLVLDSDDSAILVSDGSDGVTRVARYVPDAGSWSRPIPLAGQGLSNIAVDRSGNLTVMWIRTDGSAASIQASHYTAASGTWSAPTSLPVGGQGVRVILEPSMAADGAGNTIAVWEWFDGVQWTIQSATYSAPSNSWSEVQGMSRGPRSGSPAVRVDPFGIATVVWSNHADFSVEAARRATDGTWSRKTLAGSNALLPALAVDEAGNAVVVWTTNDAPFTATIRSTGWRNAIGAIANVPPSAPTALFGRADESTVTLAWFNTYSGGAPASLVLDVSGAHVGSFPLPLSERFTFAGVPPGTYRLAVRAVNAFGSSEPSNAVTLTFPGCAPLPDMPAGVDVRATEHYISVSWSRPASSAAPTDYLVDVTGSFVGSFATTALGISGRAEPGGSYTISVRGRNACGVSAATPAQTITIPIP